MLLACRASDSHGETVKNKTQSPSSSPMALHRLCHGRQRPETRVIVWERFKTVSPSPPEEPITSSSLKDCVSFIYSVCTHRRQKGCVCLWLASPCLDSPSLHLKPCASLLPGSLRGRDTGAVTGETRERPAISDEQTPSPAPSVLCATQLGCCVPVYRPVH